MRDGFFALTAELAGSLRGNEALFCTLDGEDSDFVRLNRNRIRQAGSLHRRRLGLKLISGDRQVEGSCDLPGGPPQDPTLPRDLLARMRNRLPQVPRDPFLDYSSMPTFSERTLSGDLPDPAQAVAAS